MIRVVPSNGVCQGEGKEMMVNTLTTAGLTLTDEGNFNKEMIRIT